MLVRPRNAGLLARGLPGKSGQAYAYEEIGPASWEVIIPEDEWRALVTMLTDPSRRHQQGNEKKWLGSGIYRCGVPVTSEDGAEHPCGGVLRATPHGVTAVRKYERRYLYRCSSSAHLTIGQKQTDEHVRNAVAELVRDPRIVAAMSPGDAHLAADRERRVALTARLEAFETGYALGNITGAQLRKFTERLEGELADVDARLAHGISRSASSSVLRAADPGEAFLEAPLDVQRAVLSTVLRIEVLPATKGGSAWDAERLRIRPVAG
ncbi:MULTISPECIES: hypothetical protein [unclassified Frondihabitans]|uniref:hypothetical protein n=1 Tax=unclassified Frondihabitans TaxID=2626248 RepID=UPI000F4EA69B|nr:MULTISPECIES: hypothetical protein [unclassified Frondihabitans]